VGSEEMEVNERDACKEERVKGGSRMLVKVFFDLERPSLPDEVAKRRRMKRKRKQKGKTTW
jgi:hypothetical protein